MTNTDTDTLIDLAADRLGALAYAGATVYGWRDDASGEVCLASPEQLADLGMRLAAGEPDAYSLWCSELSLESASPAEIAGCFPDLAGEEVDIAGLRAEAASASDLLTVAVCDLAGPALARAFEAFEAVEADEDDDAGDALRASVDGGPGEWYVTDTSGQVWHPGPVARAALRRAAAAGDDPEAAAVALCRQAPSLGVWHC